MNSIFDQDFFDQHQQLTNDFYQSLVTRGQSNSSLEIFQSIIYHFYHAKKRSFPWRINTTPYNVAVSEVMLQQTQTNRVLPKFELFIKQFPDFQSLANAPFEILLRAWKGLGYNRRALNLQRIAQIIVQDFDGQLPQDPAILKKLPGFGAYTSRSIPTFVYNKPHIFIETNIRTVFIYFFMKHKNDIDDKDIFPLIEKTIDHENPRDWYYALMDYGVMLKKEVGNLCKLSKHYSKQSQFEGSDRQIRGLILKKLLEKPHINQNDLFQSINREESRIKKILTNLCNEGFIKKNNGVLQLISFASKIDETAKTS